MNTYPIKFVDNYLEYEEWANDSSKDVDTSDYFKQKINDNLSRLELCKKWTGKEITLKEAEENIDELGEIMFNGIRILVVNGYL